MATPIMPEALQAIRRLVDTTAGSTVGINSGGWCQRWRARQHSSRHISEGGFDANRYVVTPLAERPAREFVEANHYSATWSVIFMVIFPAGMSATWALSWLDHRYSGVFGITGTVPG